MAINASQLPVEVGTDGYYYSAAELAAMRLPGKPRTRKGWYGVVEREMWEFREVEARGGKTGMRREYKPPPHVLALIEASQRGGLAPTPKAPVGRALVAASTVPPEYHAPKAEPPWINVEALTQAILSMQQLRPNEPLAEQVKKGVEFYRYCVMQGMIMRDGTGSGDLKGAA